jgi:hypothetical protein
MRCLNAKESKFIATKIYRWRRGRLLAKVYVDKGGEKYPRLVFI